MKLKKLLAAVTAAALAVSTMAVSSFTASAAIDNENGSAIADWAAGTYAVKAKADLTEEQWKECYGISFDVTSNLDKVGKFNGVISYTEDGSSFNSDYGYTDELVNIEINGKNAVITCLKDAPIDADASGYNDWTYLMLKYYWGVDGQDITVNSYTYLDSDGNDLLNSGENDDDLPKDEWFVNEDDVDTYICTNGSAPEEALLINVKEYLKNGKTLADVTSIIASYTVVAFSPNEDETLTVATSGDFGVDHNQSGVFDEDIYAEWTATDDNNTGECVINCADGLLETDECKFQINEMAANNILIVEFSVEYKEDNGEEDDNKGEDDSKTITGSVEITANNGWGQTDGTPTMQELIGDLDPAKTTITFKADSLKKVGYNSVKTEPNADNSKWFEVEAKNGEVTIEASDIVTDGYWISIAVGDTCTVTWTATESDSPATPEEPEQPETPSAKGDKFKETKTVTIDQLENGTFGLAQVEISFAESDVIELTVTPKDATKTAKVQFKAYNNDWGGWQGPDADSTLSATIKDILDMNNDVDISNLRGIRCEVTGGLEVGDEFEYTITVTSGSSSTPVTPPSTGDDDNNNDDNNNNNTDNVSTITIPIDIINYPTVIPYGYTPATDEEITNAVSSTADGDTANVNLTSNTRVEKAVFDSIAGKDVNVEFKLKGGVRWIINGKNVEKAKKVDLGVRLRSKNIPAEKIAEVAGENKTMQFSLRHNGDLGFTGVLIIPFSNAYNGKFANLYYYNTAKDELDFVGSSKISGGEASFVFTHASDYVVVIDDEAYGEDVSSAAGVYETSEETTAPYAAAVAAIAVLGVAAVVIRKRLAK